MIRTRCFKDRWKSFVFHFNSYAGYHSLFANNKPYVSRLTRSFFVLNNTRSSTSFFLTFYLSCIKKISATSSETFVTSEQVDVVPIERERARERILLIGATTYRSFTEVRVYKRVAQSQLSRHVRVLICFEIVTARLKFCFFPHRILHQRHCFQSIYYNIRRVTCTNALSFNYR